MDRRDIHHAQTAPLRAPDPSWLAAPEEEFDPDSGHTRWEDALEAPDEEFSLDRLPPPGAEAFVAEDGRVYVAAGPVDDTFEQAVLASTIGAMVMAGMCLASAFLGFLIGLAVSA